MWSVRDCCCREAKIDLNILPERILWSVDWRVAGEWVEMEVVRVGGSSRSSLCGWRGIGSSPVGVKTVIGVGLIGSGGATRGGVVGSGDSWFIVDSIKSSRSEGLVEPSV